jgi:RNA polymerase sigma-70 factor (ECF subfamily)
MSEPLAAATVKFAAGLGCECERRKPSVAVSFAERQQHPALIQCAVILVPSSIKGKVFTAHGYDPSGNHRPVAAWARGEQEALEKLLPMVEAELRRLAKNYLRRERPGHTLQTTALINEAYIKLLGQRHVYWQNRTHFYAIAAQCMRRTLIDYATSRRREKRGGGAQRVELSDVVLMSLSQSEELLALDAALRKLAAEDERKSKVVELRYFGGYNVEEIAGILNVSAATVARDWRLARAWLRREISHNKECPC